MAALLQGAAVDMAEERQVLAPGWCVDLYNNCASMKKDGYCELLKRAKANCKETCSLCEEGDKRWEGGQ